MKLPALEGLGGLCALEMLAVQGFALGNYYQTR